MTLLYIPIPQDLNILQQNVLHLYANIIVMDKNLKGVGEIQGDVIDDSFVIDSESDIRRTFNLTIFVRDSSFYLEYGSTIWFDNL